jgi:unsaturated rhamnogalacturonyl hydrolase
MLDFTGAPGLVYTFWLEQPDKLRNKNEYRVFFNEILDYTFNKQVRLPEGNFTRETPRKYTTWTDDMFMGIPFLVHSALLTSDKNKKEKLFNDAVNQVFAFNKQVFDESANLYRQAQYSDNKVKIPFWSRANGWALWAVTELLTYLPEGHPKRNQVLDHYKKHISALISHQDPKSGFWHNVLDKPDSFEETSGTAIFVMSIARGINNGWIERDKYEANVIKGWQALESNIEKDGTLHGTCVGTNMSEDIKHYYTRPVADDDTHGIFPVIFAGIEVDKILNRRK